MCRPLRSPASTVLEKSSRWTETGKERSKEQKMGSETELLKPRIIE